MEKNQNQLDSGYSGNAMDFHEPHQGFLKCKLLHHSPKVFDSSGLSWGSIIHISRNIHVIMWVWGTTLGNLYYTCLSLMMLWKWGFCFWQVNPPSVRAALMSCICSLIWIIITFYPSHSFHPSAGLIIHWSENNQSQVQGDILPVLRLMVMCPHFGLAKLTG